jgi:hypothetical protein
VERKRKDAKDYGGHGEKRLSKIIKRIRFTYFP